MHEALGVALQCSCMLHTISIYNYFRRSERPLPTPEEQAGLSVRAAVADNATSSTLNSVLVMKRGLQ